VCDWACVGCRWRVCYGVAYVTCIGASTSRFILPSLVPRPTTMPCCCLRPYAAGDCACAPLLACGTGTAHAASHSPSVKKSPAVLGTGLHLYFRMLQSYELEGTDCCLNATMGTLADAGGTGGKCAGCAVGVGVGAEVGVGKIEGKCAGCAVGVGVGAEVGDDKIEGKCAGCEAGVCVGAELGVGKIEGKCVGCAVEV
jgi:hypothetical protein